MNEEIKQKILEFAKILYEEDFSITIRYDKSERRRGNFIFEEEGWEENASFEELEDKLLKDYSKIKYLYFIKGNKFLGCTFNLKISDLGKEIRIGGHSMTLRLILKEEN